MTADNFLARLWPDICAAYRDAGLARACLDVQQTYGADVPLLLVLCLADRAGHLIGRDALVALAQGCEAWREAAIAPLRFARSELKGRVQGAEETRLRDDIKRLELEAERLQVLRLSQNFPAARPDADPTAPIYLAMRGAPAAAASDLIKTFNRAYDAQVLRVHGTRLTESSAS